MQVVFLLVLFAFKITSSGSVSWDHNRYRLQQKDLYTKRDIYSSLNSLDGNIVGVSGKQQQLPVIQASWQDEYSDDKLLRLTIDEQSGQKRVYVGGVNKIYQLSSDLKLEAQATIGPKLDSVECPVSRHCPNIEQKHMDNHIKILVIYTPNRLTLPLQPAQTTTTSPRLFQSTRSNFMQSSLLSTSQTISGQPNSYLISCGTLYQGSCALHNLDNITQYEYPANESVVANSEKASTVAFIAPGPTKLMHSKQNSQVLYVGASYSGLGKYNAEVPAVSSRSLSPESMFSYASTSVASGTRLMVNSIARTEFPIKYIHGFSSRGFSYFVTVQKKSITSLKPFITKLVRVCQKDLYYHSYVEVPLVCRTDEGVDYNLAQAAYVGKPGLHLATSLGVSTNDDVMYVAFSKSRDTGDIYDEPSQNSAVCVYSLPMIHHLFTQNIQQCFNGEGQHGLDFISQTEKCLATMVTITDDFCGMDANNLISGLVPIETSPVIEYKDVQLTAIAASPTNDFTVIYLGTSNGQLRRLVVEDAKLAVEYSKLTVDPQRRTPINADIRFDRRDRAADFIYVMNDKKVSLIKVQDCNAHKTCSECLGAYDPHCGWCSLENRCSVKSACSGASQDSLYWLSYRSGKCTTITNVNPPQIQTTITRTLALTIENLPSLDGKFLCGFTSHGKTELTPAARSLAGVTCPTPPTETLPVIAPNSHDLLTKLSVRMLEGPDFAATNFTFFDCSSYTTCTDCVSSSYPCDWCVAGHRCTHDTGDHCRNDLLVTGIKQVGHSLRSGPKHCPRIDPTDSAEIIASADVPRRIQVQVREIPPAISGSKVLCQFNIEGRVRQVEAKLLGDHVHCDIMDFTYPTVAPNITASFAVIWDNNKPLDNPDDVHILVYKCSAMADNCGLCLELPDKYKCGWCKDTNTCQYPDQCPQTQRPSFLMSSDTCPNPQVLSFDPMSGPYESGTNITIRGINLGRTFDDIQNGIMLELYAKDVRIGQIECIPFRELYIRTSQITCQLSSPINATTLNTIPGSSISAIITVRVNNDYLARSSDRFSFVNPRILSIIPSKGPVSGGTSLIIWGLDMNAGSQAEASVGGAPCHIVSRLHDRAECITSQANRPGAVRFSMRFDNGERMFHDYDFLYVDDPEVEWVSSNPITSAATSSILGLGMGSGISGGRTVVPPKGIPSGGIIVHVKGRNFVSIQQPRMYVVLDGTKYNGSCSVDNSTDMTCLSPQIPEEQIRVHRLSPEEPVELDYGFFMDNVQSVHNLASRSNQPLPMFLMFSNPEYKPFPEEVKFYKSDYLTINGSNLDRASSEGDITVRIGKEFCNVTSLSRTQLTCKPPASQPEALNWRGPLYGNELPDVVVSVGNSLNFTIGKMSYDTYELNHLFDGPLSRSLLLILVIGASFLMAIVILILIAYRRKASESSRVVKTMQEQMDVLEMKVASEAKQAFTELQTEMTDLTDDLEHGGIPYLDYRIYAMKVLFPSADDHPVLSEMQVDPKIRPNLEKGLGSFGQLILNKTFLLLFIRTLESNKYFSMRDRVNVASLIMVTLQNKMEYCTDILKTLLADLIERSMESRSHPKLLLRRTESVAEKMLSSWFTFLLYKFLRECAGEPLFLLYQAIKHQVNKGPVDMITSEARCSLSEEKLIRQSVDYKPLTVFVSISPQTAYLSSLVDPNLQNSECIEIPLRVLDCDTISQVKDKAIDAIYKSTPYSQRPLRDQLDLEWRASATSRVVMSDEDHTSKLQGYWKRLNSLAHYRVPDGAALTLVAKQNSLYNLNMVNGANDKTGASAHRYETLSHFGLVGGNTKGLISSPSTLSRPCSPPLNGVGATLLSGGGGGTGDPLVEATAAGGYKLWHLVRHHHDNDYRDGSERSGKMVSEIYLTRLLATKGTLQRFVDDLFETIFSTARLTSSLPIAIKYMFDFLDDQARSHGIMDPEVVHTWKSNSLPLRFWVNLIKNPNFVFDINKSNIVDSCLSVVAQTFMDACSTSEHRLGKDSPSSKLLYAKDLPIYKDWVERYYNEIAMMPPINEQDMNAMLAEESRQHTHEFNTNVSLRELFKYAVKYQDQLMIMLDEDEFARKAKLSSKLRQTMLIMNGDSNSLVQAYT